MTSERPPATGPFLLAVCTIVLARAAVAAEVAAADRVTIELADPRKTTVAIGDDGERYSLDVRMLRVKSFDQRSDREANRSLARSAALTALSRRLNVGRHQDLSVGELRAGAEAVEDEWFRLEFSLPKAAAKVVDRPAEPERRLDPEFAPYLLAEPLLMETEGAKVIRVDDGRVLVLGVASAALKDGSAADRKRAETVARQRALAHVVAEKTGVQVARAETLSKKTTVTIDADAGEWADSVAEYLETTRALVKGATHGFPIVGRWTSDDGTLLSVAVGGFLPP